MDFERPTKSAGFEFVVANVGCANPSILVLLGSDGAFGCRFLAVPFVKAIHASGGVYQLLLAGKERVASGADFDVQVALFRGTGLERLAAGAGNCDLDVFRMNSWFHYFLFDSL